MSMSSVGKVVYESVHRPDETLRGVGGGSGSNGGGNVLCCPSPYATTRVQLYFPTTADQERSVTTREINDQNCYDMPLLKQASYGNFAFYCSPYSYPPHSLSTINLTLHLSLV